MHSELSRKARVLALVLLILFIACGESEEQTEFSISGTVTVDKAQPAEGAPVFAAIFRGTDPSLIAQGGGDTFAGMVRVADDGTYTLDLADSGLLPGETVSLIGFLDRNFSGGIPNPDEGDLVGFYIREGAFTPGYTLEDGANTRGDIHLNREVFSYDKEIGGTVSGAYTGQVLLFAYAGDINSLDFTTIDVNSVLGYGLFEKVEAQLDYRFKILPYGFDLPISDTYLMVLFDANGNGLPDSGEAVGYYSTHPQGLPTLVTLTAEPQEHFDIDSDRAMVIAEPSLEPVSLSGHVERPDGYDDESEAPLFILVAETEDPNKLFTDPFSVTRSFLRLAPGEVNFNLDLSASGLVPGDKVMIIALWDQTHTEDSNDISNTGFPDPDAGDCVGYYQRKSDLTVSHPLTGGENRVIPLEDGNTDLRFQVNRRLVNHSASIAFTCEDGAGVNLKAGDRLLVVAVQKEGVNPSTYRITDPDYVVAMESITATGNMDDEYSVPLMGALLDTIINTPFDGMDEVYVFAILDENENGMADSGESVGFYGELLFPLFPSLSPWIPKTTDLSDKENRLDDTVRFTGETY